MMSESPGRRSAAGPRPIPPLLPALLVLAISLVAALLVSRGQIPATSALPLPTTQPITQRKLVCPDLPEPKRTRAQVVLGSAPFADAPTDGSVLADRQTVALGRGALARTRLHAAIVAEGGLAQALIAVRSDSAKAVAAALECSAPSSDWWFTGLGASVDHTSTLALNNVESGVAVLAIEVFTTRGQTDPIANSEIVLAGGESRVLEVGLLAPFNDELTVHVHATRGRVAAAALDVVSGKVLDEDAREWVGGRSGPSRVVRLAAAFARTGSAELIVTNPSGREALVTIETAGDSSWFAPVGVEPIQVGPGEVAVVRLRGIVGKDATAIRLSANHPILATARVREGKDVAYAESLPSIRDLGAILVPGRRGGFLTLVGGPGVSTVDVVAFDKQGQPVGTRAFDLTLGTGATYKVPTKATTLTVTPAEGAVFAALTDLDRGITILPVRPVVIYQRLAAVIPRFG
jgi:hypothetical protein